MSKYWVRIINLDNNNSNFPSNIFNPFPYNLKNGIVLEKTLTKSRSKSFSRSASISSMKSYTSNNNKSCNYDLYLFWCIEFMTNLYANYLSIIEFLYSNGISFNFYLILDKFYFGLIGNTNSKLNNFVTSKSETIFTSYLVRFILQEKKNI